MGSDAGEKDRTYLERNRDWWNRIAPDNVARAVSAWSGELVFLANSTLLTLCMPDRDDDLPVSAELVRDSFGLHRIDWPDEDSVEFHLGHGDWIRLFRENELEVIELLELRPPAGAETTYDFVEAEWARRWPSEEVWRLRKKDGRGERI